MTDQSAGFCAALLGSLNSLVFDFVTRQKLGGMHLSDYITKQLPVPSPTKLTENILDYIVPRVLELTYTSNDLSPFYFDVTEVRPEWDNRIGLERKLPWSWDPERRAILRAELDAIYARLYGLTRDDLRYILDPSDIMGHDYPSETFRGLKAKEIRHLGEYRTRRLVLEAWDKLEQGEL